MRVVATNALASAACSRGAETITILPLGEKNRPNSAPHKAILQPISTKTGLPSIPAIAMHAAEAQARPVRARTVGDTQSESIPEAGAAIMIATAYGVSIAPICPGVIPSSVS